MNKETLENEMGQKMSEVGGTTEIDLIDLLYYLKTKLILLIAALLIGAVIAGVGTYFFVTPTYQASSYIYMVSASSGSVIDLSDLNLGTSVATDYIQLLTRRPILENVSKEVDGIVLLDGKKQISDADQKGKLVISDAKQLAGYISITPLGDSRVLTISVTTPYPKLSKEMANELADQAVQFIPDIMNVSAPTVAEYAVTPTSKYAPSYKKNITYGALICLVLVGAVLTALYIMDDSIKTSEDIERYIGVTPLTVIPEGAVEDMSDTAGGKKKKGKRTKI